MHIEISKEDLLELHRRGQIKKTGAKAIAVIYRTPSQNDLAGNVSLFMESLGLKFVMNSELMAEASSASDILNHVESLEDLIERAQAWVKSRKKAQKGKQAFRPISPKLIFENLNEILNHPKQRKVIETPKEPSGWVETFKALYGETTGYQGPFDALTMNQKQQILKRLNK